MSSYFKCTINLIILVLSILQLIEFVGLLGFVELTEFVESQWNRLPISRDKLLEFIGFVQFTLCYELRVAGN